jgi:hypothetical protein
MSSPVRQMLASGNLASTSIRSQLFLGRRAPEGLNTAFFVAGRKHHSLTASTAFRPNGNRIHDVRDGPVTALRTGINMATQRCCAAVLDGAEPLRCCQVSQRRLFSMKSLPTARKMSATSMGDGFTSSVVSSRASLRTRLRSSVFDTLCDPEDAICGSVFLFA